MAEMTAVAPGPSHETVRCARCGALLFFSTEDALSDGDSDAQQARWTTSRLFGRYNWGQRLTLGNAALPATGTERHLAATSGNGPKIWPTTMARATAAEAGFGATLLRRDRLTAPDHAARPQSKRHEGVLNQSSKSFGSRGWTRRHVHLDARAAEIAVLVEEEAS
jgi:hypothetical protein